MVSCSYKYSEYIKWALFARFFVRHNDFVWSVNICLGIISKSIRIFVAECQHRIKGEWVKMLL